MKHASGHSLKKLAPLLAFIRKQDLLQEKKPGIFYRKSQAFLHFHEDPAGLFVDIKIGQKFERFPVNNGKEWKQFQTILIDVLQ